MTYSQADITVPYAVANFAEIRHKGYYYVDKTNYIPLLERYKAPVFSVLADLERVCSFPCWLTITTVTWQHNSKNCLVELGLANTQQTSTTNILW